MAKSSLTVWFTGLPGSGKSTLSLELERRLTAAGRACIVLDGDKMRAGLSRDLGFSEQDRHENLRRIAEVAKLFNDAGLITIAALISPYRRDREMAREIVGPTRFLEVYLSAPVEVCERRDPKGQYRRARAGEILQFTGISAPYEIPENPALELDTAGRSVAECTDAIFQALTLEAWRG